MLSFAPVEICTGNTERHPDGQFRLCLMDRVESPPGRSSAHSGTGQCTGARTPTPSVTLTWRIRGGNLTHFKALLFQNHKLNYQQGENLIILQGRIQACSGCGLKCEIRIAASAQCRSTARRACIVCEAAPH